MNPKKIKILIIGGGGREHAIGWKVAQSPRCGELFFAPGNAGTLSLGTNVDIKATDIESLLSFAKKESIDLTLALPDDPLALGVVDLFRENGLRIFGPTQSASKLESSKAFAKEFMRENRLPTAKFKVFTDITEATSYVDRQMLPIVIKASGLALGKGVVIAQNFKEAHQALEDMLVNKVFGDAGSQVVIEEFMTGPEVSTHAFSDGESFSIFPMSQDHKRIGEGDTGPNTGGMGTICPLPFVNDDLTIELSNKIFSPTINAMKESGIPFEGVLYPGLMLTVEGPKILEYNARFGDPETQVYMRLLDTDLLDIIDACIDKNLGSLSIKWKPLFACTIILASSGYPGVYEKGRPISGIQEAELDQSIVVFHAGTTMKDGVLVTNGGRVLGVSAMADTLEKALKLAYEAVSKVSFEGMQYRKDIGKKALLLK